VGPARPSRRQQLARLAIEAALEVDGVAAGHPGVGGVYVTEASGLSGARATGVVATARPDGRFDVELHLVVRPVPLLPLGEEIRSRVLAAATEDGLTDRLGVVDIGFEDVLEVAPAEPPALGEV
jgi:hypothetical protein